MLKFIVDTQLPRLLANYLNAKGYDTKHTTDFPEGHLLEDTEIISISITEDRVIITKDKDFLHHYILQGAPPKVLLLQLGNCSNKNLLGNFEIHFSQILAAFEAGAAAVLFGKAKIIAY